MGIFTQKKRQQVIRGIRSPFMNLAHRIIPTTGGVWDTFPTSLEKLTDENRQTECVAGSDNDAAEVYIQVDLGAEHEVYLIEIQNKKGHGFEAGAGGLDTDFTLKTLDNDNNVITRDTQSVLQDTDWYDITLGYNGSGIKVRYVRLCVSDPDGSGMMMQPCEIAVYGS